jgi:N-acetylneuraminic acid mutarotase
MATARAWHTATLLASGRVLVAGGHEVGGRVAFSSAEIFDPADGTGSWSATGSMVSARAWHTATLLASGKVLIAGGHEVGGVAALGTAEIYDPTTGSWAPAGSMGNPRAWHTATLLIDGKVLVAGGSRGGGDLFSTTAEIYDPGSGAWSLTGSLGFARIFHTDTLLPGGEVLVVGGRSTAGLIGAAELYDPVGLGPPHAGLAALERAE